MAREHDIKTYVPDPPEGLIGFDRSVELALSRIQDLEVPTSWSSASTAGAPSAPLPSDPDWAGGDLYSDARSREVAASPAALWRVIEEIGGDNGWYSFGLAWRVRGWIDRFSGGPGLRRGRRNPRDLVVGDPLDWWRVEEIEQGRFMRLRAEMRLPGLAWLELEVGSGRGRVHDVPAAGAVPPSRGVRAGRTGGRSTRSTGSSSAACSATSPAPPSASRPTRTPTSPPDAPTPKIRPYARHSDHLAGSFAGRRPPPHPKDPTVRAP